MESKQVREGGDGSDGEVFDNWTIIDTEEADEAICLEEKSHEEEPGSEEAPVSEDLPRDDDCPTNEDSEEFCELEAGCESDDGVSIITDSEPEERQQRRFSEHSNDYFDHSDVVQELPEDLGEQRDRKYVHRPNQRLNLVLNGLLIVCIASVVGLGLGHFLGLQEECSGLENVDPKSLLAKLEAENDLLKAQLWQLQQDLQVGVKQGWETATEMNAEPGWDLSADPDHHTEPAGVVWSAGLNPIQMSSPEDARVRDEEAGMSADNHSQMSSLPDNPNQMSSLPDNHIQMSSLPDNPIQMSSLPDNPIQMSSPENARVRDEEAGTSAESKPLSQYEQIQFPYTDEDLEIIQTRYAREALERNSKEYNSGKERKDSKKTYSSFFSKMEAELNGVMNHVLHYSSNFVKTHNVKERVVTSIDVLSNTLQDMQVKVKSLSESTAKHSIHAMDKVTKSVYKMVQKVKHASNDILKRQHDSGSISNKVIKGVHHLKEGLVSNWCRLKKKMALGEQDEECRLPSKRQSEKQQHFGDKKNLHHDSPFKPKSELTKGYIDQKKFELRMKQNKSASHHKNKKDYYKTQSVPKYSAKEHKMKGQNARLKRQEWRERVWKVKEECSRDENCSVTDGEWMARLAEGRARQRQAEHKSDWMFERARARQREREGWFLRRGKSREQGRVIHQGYSRTFDV